MGFTTLVGIWGSPPRWGFGVHHPGRDLGFTPLGVIWGQTPQQHPSIAGSPALFPVGFWGPPEPSVPPEPAAAPGGPRGGRGAVPGAGGEVQEEDFGEQSPHGPGGQMVRELRPPPGTPKAPWGCQGSQTSQGGSGVLPPCGLGGLGGGTQPWVPPVPSGFWGCSLPPPWLCVSLGFNKNGFFEENLASWCHPPPWGPQDISPGTGGRGAPGRGGRDPQGGLEGPVSPPCVPPVTHAPLPVSPGPG